MQLQAKELLERRFAELKSWREALSKRPCLALIWVGNDSPTEKFVNAKKKMASDLNCDFSLHHFDQIEERQLAAVIDGLNSRKNITGMVLQLPLINLNAEKFIAQLNPEKDIDGLALNSKFVAPTPAGIMALLKENKVNPVLQKTVVIGDGKLVGRPLAKLFKENSWPFVQINNKAENHISEIKKCNLVISCTGVAGMITPAMVTKETIVIDGSGVDVDVKIIEPLVRMITPPKGAIGPLTVSFLFENLLKATDF